MTRKRLLTYLVSHDGGPWPWMGDLQPGVYDQLETSLLDLRRELRQTPRAVLMVSAHWPAHQILVSFANRPWMVFDYQGFPEHTYHIRYDAPGSPALAETVCALLEREGLPSGLDPQRGFDHGTFTLMHMIYPEANMPLVQLSLRDNRKFRSGAGAAPSAAFDAWLNVTLVESSPDERRKRLLFWEMAPAARVAHPREDHLIPLMVAVGAAGSEAGVRVYHQTDFMQSITVSSYRFGAPACAATHEMPSN